MGSSDAIANLPSENRVFPHRRRFASRRGLRSGDHDSGQRPIPLASLRACGREHPLASSLGRSVRLDQSSLCEVVCRRSSKRHRKLSRPPRRGAPGPGCLLLRRRAGGPQGHHLSRVV